MRLDKPHHSLRGNFCIWDRSGKGRWRKLTELRPWTKEDVRTLKTLAREKTKTTVIARKLKRTLGATYQKAKELWGDVGGRPEEEGVELF
jgi:hypothetical protein